MTFPKRWMNALTDALERNAQQRTREYLLGLSDGFLADMGLSRELIKQGPDAWPWRIPQEPVATLAAPLKERNTDSDAQSTDHERRNSEQAVGYNRRATDTKWAA
jgi:hypothetical protein